MGTAPAVLASPRRLAAGDRRIIADRPVRQSLAAAPATCWPRLAPVRSLLDQPPASVASAEGDWVAAWRSGRKRCGWLVVGDGGWWLRRVR